MTEFLQFTVSGLMHGATYALIALGFVLIYKSTGVFNLAQGEFVLIPAFTCWAFLVLMNLPLWLGFVLTLVLAGVLGLMMERLLIRPLVGQSILAMVMMTIVISIGLQGMSKLIWGVYTGAYPEFISRAGLNFGPVSVSTEHIMCFATAIVLLIMFMLFFKYSRLGLSMRAVAEGHQVAQSTGMSIGHIFTMTWIIAAVISAIGGILLGSISGVHMRLSDMGLKALPAALLGGLDSVPGVIIGGLVIGVLEGLSTGYIDPLVGGGTEAVMPFIIMILVLIIRPYGLFGLRRIERV